jgi:choline dehydrogenase-like flavoprotein
VRRFDVNVADASVMPTIPRANTHLTALAIAERAATRT